jgi:hypothetical protein
MIESITIQYHRKLHLKGDGVDLGEPVELVDEGRESKLPLSR